MADKYGLGSWLEGPGGSRAAEQAGSYPGERLGLPASGSGSIAGMGIRLVAYLIDSGASALIAWGVLGSGGWTLAVFAGEVLVLTAVAGSSFGHRVAGLRVFRLDGRPFGPVRAAIRTGLLLLLIPALVWDRDGRGLHDRAAGTVLVRAR